MYGPYHAPHLHKGIDLQQFITSDSSPATEFWNSYRLRLPLRSTSAGTRFDQSLDTTGLLTEILREILNEKTSIPRITEGCVEQLALLHQYDCGLIVCSSSRAKNALAHALRSRGNAKVAIKDFEGIEQPATGSRRTSRKTKLAIVGMAGRFPDAANHERFWELLEAGIDLHRKVLAEILKCDSKNADLNL